MIATIDLVVFSLVIGICVWTYYRQHQDEFKDVLRGWESCTTALGAVISRLFTDLVLLVLTILGITVELILFLGKRAAVLSRSLLGAIDHLLLEPFRPTAAEIALKYDNIKHGHHANSIRQSVRENARICFSPYLRYAAIISILVMIAFGPPAEEDFDSITIPEVHDFVVPDWVIDAQPHNRPTDRSSCHYRSADETVSNRLLLVRETSTVADSAESTWHSKSTTARPSVSATETSGLVPLVTAEPATAGVAMKRSAVRDETVAYCEACSQKHCCEVVYD